MRPAGWIALLALLGGAAPLAALEVCRESALGVTICTGLPTHGLDPINPYPRAGRTPPPAAPPEIPEARTNSFGDTMPNASETTAGRPRPRVCRADSFGNLRC